jgi:4-hydroxybenzoate polyprenyltransferase
VWLLVAGALLGIGAHLLNTLPDIPGDLRTGVVGLPQRLGADLVRVLAPVVLLLATAIVVVRPGGRGMGTPGWVAFGVGVALAGGTIRTRGRTPFITAMAIAGLDVLAIVLVPPA